MSSAVQASPLPRVLFYSPAADFKGGAERSLMDLVATPGIQPVVLCPSEGALAGALRRIEVRVHVISFGMIDDIKRPFQMVDGFRALSALLSRARAVKALCRSEQIDIVHSNGLKAHVVAVVARMIGGRPTIVHLRDIPLTKQERAVWLALRVASSRLILVSRACWPSSRLPRKASVIFNGIRIAQHAADRVLSPEIPLTLGFFGRIHQAKGLHILLEWLPHVINAGMQVRLIIRGVFYVEAGDYEKELHDLIERLGLSQNVEFQEFRTDPSTVYDEIDVVCVPSHVPDPLPRAVMEAMALGLPVVAYPAGGILEMIDDGRDGFLVANQDELLTALRRLYDDQARRAISRAARYKASTRFSLSNLHTAISAVYQEMVTASRS